MYGLILVGVIVFMVAFFTISKIKIKELSRAWLCLVSILLSLFVVIIFIMVSEQVAYNLVGLEWRETGRNYLDSQEKITTLYNPKYENYSYVFIPVVGHQAILTLVKDTNICSYGHSGKPFLVRYVCEPKRYQKWFLGSFPKKWQAYLKPGTLVAGNRIE